MNPILHVKDLSKSFGGLVALQSVDLKAETAQIVGLIGPNGAGKTTLFNCLTGLTPPTQGQIEFRGNPIVPQFSEGRIRLLKASTLLFFILGWVWVPLFYSLFLPRTFFKVELVLLGIFILGMRCLMVRAFVEFKIWAWSLMFVFLLSDLITGLWAMSHWGTSIALVGAGFPFGYVALPWAIVAVPFSLFFMGLLLSRRVRLLYGFRVSPDALCRMGMGRTFQNIRLFFNLSVLDNVKIGFHGQLKSGFWQTLIRGRSQRQEEESAERAALEALRFVDLQHRTFDLASSLAYGEQRWLEIARALVARPHLLLLDEPAAGMNPQESARLMDLIFKIRKMGTTVLIIEHDMKVMMNLADNIFVLDYGEMIAQGSPDEIRDNPRVIEAYLGGGPSTC
ncbi:MAG: ABC transporter ATP-binding protein [Deltaproteobacteria bacterium]|nr:ABC transporter ATP-binding protein [Deltaproteobacteria bacterium]